MAMMDNPTFLLSHIRNSFITSDDTGMCELIIDSDEQQAAERHPSGTDKRPTTWHGPKTSEDSSFSDSGLESDTELAHSFDILPDMDFAAHRRRSNTAQRLEKLKREKHKQSKIKHIQWKDVEHPVDEIGEYFVKKEVISTKGNKAKTSLLSQQLEQFATSPNNPFMEFAKFDGKAHAGIPTKKIGIFLTMQDAEERAFPMTVVTLVTAKVQDLIGLICWQYIMEGRQPPLKERTVEAYALHIAEDDGEVDTDFPALDNREPISKFGFAKLALVEKDLPKKSSPKTSIVVTVNLPHRGFSKLSIDSDSILMREILDRVLRKRKLHQTKGGLEYMLERQNEPGVPIELDLPLNSLDTTEFCLVRENSTRGDVEVETIPSSMSAMAESLSSHQYKSYMVNMSHKLRTNTEVQLGISGEKIEIDPLSSKGKLFKQKAMTYDTENIADCMVLDQKHSGKASFRLVYQSGHDFRHHDFESDIPTAKEIVQKINNILEMRSSPVRKDYVAHREKKQHKRHTLHF